MSTADEVITALESVTGEMAVRTDRDLDLFDNQVLDSLRTIQLLAALSQRCHADIALTEIERDLWATPNKIIAFMEDRVGI